MGNRRRTSVSQARAQGRASAGQFGRFSTSTFVVWPDKIDQFFNSADGEMAKELLKTGVKIERRAKMLCPVDTGRLRSSINHRVTLDERGIAVEVGTNVEYAIYVEMGTRKMQARPFLRGALSSVLGGQTADAFGVNNMPGTTGQGEV